MKKFFKKMKINSLNKKNKVLLKQAMETQRNGKLEAYGKLIQESEKIISQIKTLEAEIN